MHRIRVNFIRNLPSIRNFSGNYVYQGDDSSVIMNGHQGTWFGEAFLSLNPRSQNVGHVEPESDILELEASSVKLILWPNTHGIPLRIVCCSSKNIYGLAEWANELYEQDPCTTLLVLKESVFWNEADLLNRGFANCMKDHLSGFFMKAPEDFGLKIVVEKPKPLKGAGKGTQTLVKFSV